MMVFVDRGRAAYRTMAPGLSGCFEQRSFVFVETKCFRQKPKRLVLWRAARGALETADRAGTQPRALSKLLL